MKLIIVGDGGVGKSSYVAKLKNQSIKQHHIPTLGLETTKITYKGKRFDIWDTSGTEKFSGLKDGYYHGSNCAIIMISDTKQSYEKIEKYKTTILKTCGNIPTVVVVNKCELDEAGVNYCSLQNTEHNVVLVSCKENISIYEPLDKLINMLHH